MSELQYSGANGAVSNLGAGETAFLIGNGPHAGLYVRVSVLAIDEDLDGDGEVDQVNLKVGGGVVDVLNQLQQNASGRAYLVPTQTESINASALANGTLVLDLERARMMDECVHRILRFKSVLDSLATIPAAS